MPKWIACGIVALAALFGLLAARPASAQIWKHIVPASYSQEVPKAGAELTQDSGPWLIVVASFDGDGAAEQAKELADELRTRHRLTAYVHDHNFVYGDGKNAGRGIDNYGAPLRTRYQQEQAHQYAVLVGDFQSNDDPQAQRTLKQIKTLPSKVLEGDTPDTAMEEVRQFSTNVMGKISGRARGPMYKAFFTRNPLLPREYFVPKGVDDFVAKMSQGFDHNLLDCPGRYTVQVATFRGKTVLQSSGAEPEAAKKSWSWGKDKSDPLVEAAENAHLLVEELRKHGYEAYEFHDRTESIVAIGSFDNVGQRLPNGQLTPTPDVQKLIEKFGAAYNTPSDPLLNVGNDAGTQRRVEDVKQQFSQMLSTQNGQVASGMNPKHVKILRGRKVERIIPMDVYPHTIEVPKRSVSGAYVGG
jgi:hypothetical protein